MFSVVGPDPDPLRGTVTHHGLHVLDVSGMSAASAPTSRVIMRDRWQNAHTLHVDRAKGRLYICGASAPPHQNMMYVYDIRNFDGVNPPIELLPGSGTNPPIALKTHDAFSRGSRAYVAMPGDPRGSSGENGVFEVFNLTPSPPAVLPACVWPASSAGLAHNIWVSEDERLIVTTEKGFPGRLRLYQVASPPLSNAPPMFMAEYFELNDLALPEAPHNAYGIGRTIYLAHYTAGFQVIDATNPSNPIRCAFYDTHPETPGPNDPAPPPADVPHGSNCGPWQHSTSLPSIRPGYFRGAYDCWPYQDSGYVYISDSERGLFVLEILAGHFFRTQAAFKPPTNGDLTSVCPNVYPSGATPRLGATGFAFRLTGLAQGGRYEFRLRGDAAEDLPPAGTIGWYVGPTTILTATDATNPVLDPSGEVLIPWACNALPLTDLYAQVIRMDAQGQPIGSSKLIRFALLP